MRISKTHGVRIGPNNEQHSLWYKDAIIYELHVRAFYDSDGDGIGDFRGLTEKLDYLQDLGVTAIWLLPFYPSPLKDDGYDIADYTNIHPSYGTLHDFKVFLREAHQRSLRVITELVLNHTSDQHSWFRRAQQAKPGSVARNFYVWSDTPERYKEARVIFKDFEPSNWTWDPIAEAYYWHRFYSHQPDLNYANPHVLAAIVKVIEFWLRLGVDGLRLDAVPYLAEAEGTHSENLAETHAILQYLRRHLDQRFTDRMLLAEANQWPEDAVAYFGNGDECHMAFHFPLMPRLFMGIRQEDRFPIIDILAQTPVVPETCQWALFLRNHDELTLEMVTEEERLYMYRAYAYDQSARINLGIRRRLAPLLGNHRRRIELLNSLLFSLPGTPVIYYGDELGMGDNIYLGDRHGVRTPMQWSADRNAGFSHAHPQRLYLPLIVDHEYHHETVHVEAQQQNPHSLLWWMKRLIALRKRYQAFGRGSLEFLSPENRKVLAFIRRYQDEQILVVANLSRFTQYCELDLSAFQGLVPIELFGRTVFPPIGEQPYVLTLSPHTFHWFALELPRGVDDYGTASSIEGQAPILAMPHTWKDVIRGEAKAELEKVLPRYLQTRPWFLGGRTQLILSTKILETIAVPDRAPTGYITLIRVEYAEGEPETYVLPLAFAAGDQADYVQRHFGQVIVARLRLRTSDRDAAGILYDAMWEPRFARALLVTIDRRRRFKGIRGELQGTHTAALRYTKRLTATPAKLVSLQQERNNTSIIYEDRAVLKLFRRLDEGVNPDLEIGRFLTEGGFAHIPPVTGMLEYHRRHAEPMTLAILERFVPNDGDAWQYTLDKLNHYFARVRSSVVKIQKVSCSVTTLLEVLDEDPPALAHEMIGSYLQAVRLLGQRTAELHLTLSANTEDRNFTPEPFTPLYQRSLYQTMRGLTMHVFHMLRQRWRELPEPVQIDAQQVLDCESEILNYFRVILTRKLTALRLRCHGNYHLEQVLCTANDFVIIDFEGEPARPLFERQLKRSPLQDVASMLRSFHYVVHAALSDQQVHTDMQTDDRLSIELWARFWQHWVSVVFLQAYCATAAQGTFLPQTREELTVLLNAYILEKAVYELGHELRRRPDWVRIPLQGILHLLKPLHEQSYGTT